jgi:hypothetical protein
MPYGVRRSRILPIAPLLAAAGLAACGGDGGRAGTVEHIEVADVGFATPESVLHDPVADVYLVSNINGSPTARADNGFISRVSPDGEVLELKWIQGDPAGVALHAPKGMAIRGDTLFVADIECVRMFHRVTGEPEGVMCLDGVTFLNDVAIGPEGSLFVTDSGLQSDGAGNLIPSGTDAVYRYPLEEGRLGATLARGPDLGHPNGIAVGSRGIFVVTFGTGEIFRLTGTGERTQVLPPSETRQLDGIVFLPDGGFLFSDWGSSAVYRVGGDGRVSTVIDNVRAPADIGYDAQRNRVLIPLFMDDKVIIRGLGN